MIKSKVLCGNGVKWNEGKVLRSLVPHHLPTFPRFLKYPHGNRIRDTFLPENSDVNSWPFEQYFSTGINYNHNALCFCFCCCCFFKSYKILLSTKGFKIFTLFPYLLYSFLLPNKYESSCS